MELFSTLVILAIALIIWFGPRIYFKRRRRKKLLAKYGDPRIVDKIMSRSFWMGQTQTQLIDSLGQPADVDQKVMKSKTKETWKYNPLGGNKYGLRITVEDGVVAGWDQKD